MAKEYITGTGGCVGNSLANLLIGMGDEHTGKHVARAFRKHPFVRRLPGGPTWGIPGFQMPGFIHDITNGAYRARVVPLQPDDLFDYYLLEGAYDVSYKYENPKTRGLSLFRLLEQAFLGDADPYAPPGILATRTHAVAHPSPDQVIDDGKLLDLARYERYLHKKGGEFLLGIEVRESS